MAWLLGYDVGSSSIKATLLDAETGSIVASATSPRTEMAIQVPQPGWAEQDPESWWQHIGEATREIQANISFDPNRVAAMGISYQMHGLVLVDKAHKPLRPAIIWCDSRAVATGERAAAALGAERCLESLLNLPGNFTASKLRWVKDNEPAVYAKAHRFMLPGDYIAMRLTGDVRTTCSGLSEGILWDYPNEARADFLLDHFGISPELVPEQVPIFGNQGTLTATAAEALGLKAGTPVTYRAGDQPNNAFSLGVLNPGEAAVTAGTSGVVYGVGSSKTYDPRSRVNTFVHVNHAADRPRYGVLLCLNGAGILNSWLKHQLGDQEAPLTYARMDELAASVPPGSDGLRILPYGNGAERTLDNRDPGAALVQWHFNRHTRNHMLRAAQEGIVFALEYGLGVMRTMGMSIQTVRAGHANMFRSPLFAEVFATVTQATVELYNTDGAQGAARGAGLGSGLYADESEAFVGLRPLQRIEPNADLRTVYAEAYADWEGVMSRCFSL